MAEFGAHLTSSTTPNDDRPSFFEVLAQESLMSTLRPALKHIIRILAESNPQHFGWTFRYAEELYTGIELVLQHHFLRTTSASFAENFYGMKRVPSSSQVLSGLPHREHIKSLLLLVIVPYVKLKLDGLFEKWQQKFWDQPTGQNVTAEKLQKTFLTVYPFLHMMWEGLILICQLRYLFQKTDCHSPFLHIAGVRLKYLTKEDILKQQNLPEEMQIPNGNSRFPQQVSSYLHKGIGTLAIAISQGLSLGVFFLQFLEWWYMSESYQTQIAVTSLPIPDPPKAPQELLEEVAAVSNANICQLCNKQRTNDTALATSGYVFCYPCIFSHVKSHKRCPVRSYPTELSHLVKLYPPS